MQMVIEPAGRIRCLYEEAIDLAALGPPLIRRGSHVEPTENGEWMCDLSPVSGPLLGPFGCRSLALATEVAWLEANWLAPAK